jgi:hypothetical protein
MNGALCYTNYLQWNGSPKSFCKKGELGKHFCTKNSEMKSLKLLERGIVKCILGKYSAQTFS